MEMSMPAIPKEPIYSILCFGDSNTYGTYPCGGRWGRWERWTGRLQLLLGERYYVLEEGCGGRTTVYDDELEMDKNGRKALPVILHSHRPLDLVVLMLGTNDMKHRMSLLPCDIANGAGELIQMIQRSDNGGKAAPQVLLLSPIHLGREVEHSCYGGFTAEAYEKSLKLAALYSQKAKELHCHFLDAASICSPSPRDQLHMEKEDHAKLAEALAVRIRSILEGNV